MLARYVIPITKRASPHNFIPHAHFSTAAIRYARPPAPKPVRRTTPAPAVNSLDSQEHLSEKLFPPFITLHSAQASGYIVLKPAICLEVLRRYISLAKSGKRDWEKEITEDSAPGADDSVSPHTLGRLGILARRGPTKAHQTLGQEIMETASKLGDIGATIELLKGAMKSKTIYNQSWREKRALLEAVALKGENLEAMIFYGRLIESVNSEKSTDDALKWYIKASQVGSDPNGEFAWEASEALVHQGRIYMERRQTQKAKEALKKAALEFDNAHAYQLLGELQESGSATQESYFLKAASSGISKAYKALGRLYFRRSMTKEGKEDDLKYAVEWLQLDSEPGSKWAYTLGSLSKTLFNKMRKTTESTETTRNQLKKYLGE